MPIYAQLNEHGTVFAVTASRSEIEASNMILLASYDTDLLGQHWTGSEWQATANVPPRPANEITPLALRARFTAAERAAIEWASVDRSDTSNEERRNAAELRSHIKDRDLASTIALNNPDLIAALVLMESMGLLSASRAREILDTPVELNERT